MYGRFKIIHPRHSGRLRSHEYTSYGPLAVLIVFVGFLLISFSAPIVSAGDPPPQANSVSLTGIVPAAPPKTGATITVPSNQQHFSTSPITVSGTCPAGVLVEVYKNNIFGGSTPCDSHGTYSIQVDLLYGQNSLTVQVYDALNQAGPVSAPVTVYYDASPPVASPLTLLNFTGSQLILNTNSVYRGSFPNEMLNVPVSIIGGTEPFAVNVEWGDSNNKVIQRSVDGVFNAGHAYQKPGTYAINLQASDSQQRQAFLTVAAIINGQPGVVAGVNTTKSSTNKLLVLWPLYAIAATLVVSFWMGERREKKIIKASTPIQNMPLGTPAS